MPVTRKGICSTCGRRTWHFNVRQCRSCYMDYLRSTRRTQQTGALNHQWLGADVKTGHDRALRLFPILGDCENGCGKPARERHHKSGDHRDNRRENVMFVCRRCHMEIDGRMSKLRTGLKRKDK